MKVLILHQHFKSPKTGGAIRSYYLAKALVDRGIEVVVITGSNEKKYRNEILEGIEIHHLPIAYENAFGFVKRSISFMIYVWKSVRLAKTISGIKICYAISTPLTVGLAAMRLKRIMNLPYVFEVGDLWPDAPIQMGFVKNHFLASLLYRLEKKIYQKADSIVALSASIKKEIEGKVKGKVIHLIPNIADCTYYQPEEKAPSIEEKYGVKGKFVVSYIGALGAANGLDYFVACANASKKSDLPIQFIICGDGAMMGFLRSEVKRLQLQNVLITGFVGREAVREIMNITDAVFVCYKNIPILETGSPNKYFDGLASGKLIINNFGGWIKDEIEQLKCGTSVDPNNPADFVIKIQPFINEGGKLIEYQGSSRKLAEEKYSRTILGSRFADIFGVNMN